jgi:hypothetical protein
MVEVEEWQKFYNILSAHKPIIEIIEFIQRNENVLKEMIPAAVGFPPK